MPWWEGFAGWALTTMLAGVAAVGVVADWIQRRRTRPAARLVVQGVGVLESGGSRYRIFTVSNTGFGPANLLRVVPIGVEREHPREDFIVPSALAPAAEARFAVRDADLSRAYVQLMWAQPSDGRLHLKWQPLEESGPLALEASRQASERRGLKARVRRLVPSSQKPVGPGGVLSAAIRPGADRRIAAALGDHVSGREP